MGGIAVCAQAAAPAPIPTTKQLQGPANPISLRRVPDAETRKTLLEQHLPEVRYIARRIHGRLPLHVPLEDLVHDGVLGLIDAIDKFDPRRQVQLKSYAKFRIRGAILDSLRASDWSPRRLRRQGRLLREVHREMMTALGRAPTEAELADQLSMKLADFQQLLADLRGLDLTSLGNHSGESLQDELLFSRSDHADDDPFSLCLREEMKCHLASVLDDLDGRERRILELYYRDELTMKEIGAILGIGESRVSQIHSATMLRLRTRLMSRLRSSPAA